MKKYFAIMFIVAGMLTIKSQPAVCEYCPPHVCYGPCGDGCTCVTPPGRNGGNCYRIEFANHFLESGWKVQ